MKKYSVILLFISLSATSQSPGTITGNPDTSYTNHSAYLSTKKKYPDIQLVEELHSPAIKEKKNVAYCTIKNSGGERKLMLDAFYPTEITKIKRTAILIIHGGRWRSGNRNQHYALAQRLALLGYVCFTPEYRLSTEALFPAAVHDLKAAVKWIRKHGSEYNIDTSKITALGFSAGGELAAFLGNTNGKGEYDSLCDPSTSSSVNAIIDIDGTLSFVHTESGEGDDSKKISAATAWFGVPKKDNLQLWEEASPLSHAGPNTVPTLFINSSVERMHAGCEDYISILKKHSIYTEVHEFPDSPHSFILFHPWIDPAIKYMDDFLKKIFHKNPYFSVMNLKILNTIIFLIIEKWLKETVIITTKPLSK